MKVAGIEIPGLGFGILSLIVLILAYYFGSRTGKAKNAPIDLSKDIAANDLSYDLSQYAIFADRLEEAMKGMGTDDDAIYNVFTKMRTNSDVLQLIKAFGKRGNWLNGGASTLSAWLQSDMNEDEISRINDILLRNHISYSF